jgi:DNA-binding NarL/FixJ family response regulator
MRVLEYSLSNIDKDILTLVKQGLDNNEIANKTCFSVRYIENTIQQLYRKFEIDHNNQKIKRVLLVLKAIDLKQ